MLMECCVIIPTYNGGQYLQETLRSVVSQDHMPAEIIVVDDCSTDNTLDILSEFKQIKLYRNKKNNGPGISRVFALGKTASPLVIFLDQDDLWHPQHLKLLYDELIKNPNAPAIVSRIVNFPDGDEPEFDITSQPSSWFNSWGSFPLINYISSPSAVLIKRDHLDRVGGWAANFTGVADYHLWLRLCSHHPLRLLKTVTIGRRIHNNSYHHRFISNSPLQRMALRYEAGKDALEYLANNYQGRSKNRKYIATKRLELYGHLYTFTDSIINNTDENIPELVKKIAAIYESSTNKKLVNIFIHLFNNFPQYRNKLFASLNKHWPKQFTITKDKLRKLVRRTGAGL